MADKECSAHADVFPAPPWVFYPGVVYGAPSEWHSDPYVLKTWRPFWDAANPEERVAYLARFPPPTGWGRFIEHVGFDQEVARIDADDIANGVLQPNGAPWPSIKAAAVPFWRKLFVRRRH